MFEEYDPNIGSGASLPLIDIPAGSTIYISGPMSGIAEDNKRAFSVAADELRSRGYNVVNPHDLNFELTLKLGRTPTYPECIREDILVIARDCDAIYMLNGWHRSPGAKLELENALRFELPVLFEKHLHEQIHCPPPEPDIADQMLEQPLSEFASTAIEKLDQAYS